MSDFGIFESAVVEDDAPAQQAKQASRRLEAAIYDVHQHYGPFLFQASGKDEFEDRWHYSKNDIRKTVEPHLLPVTGVMRRVHDALKREYKRHLADDTSAWAGVQGGGSVPAPGQQEGALSPDVAAQYGPPPGSPTGVLTPNPVGVAEAGHSDHVHQGAQLEGRHSLEDIYERGRSDEPFVNVDPHDRSVWRNQPGPLDSEHYDPSADPDFIPAERIGAFQKGAPFAGYKNFKECVASNQDKSDPEAYCGSIKHDTEDKKKSSRRTALHREADKTGPDQHLEQTDYHSDADLIPSDDFEGYKDSVDQGGPEKVQSHDFGQRSGEDDWENTRESRIAVDLYTDWAQSNGLRVASLNTLALYSPNCSDAEYQHLASAIRRGKSDALDHDCPVCEAEAGEHCEGVDGTHKQRKSHAEKVAKADALDHDCPTCEAEAGEECEGIDGVHKQRKGALLRTAKPGDDDDTHGSSTSWGHPEGWDPNPTHAGPPVVPDAPGKMMPGPNGGWVPTGEKDFGAAGGLGTPAGAPQIDRTGPGNPLHGNPGMAGGGNGLLPAGTLGDPGAAGRNQADKPAAPAAPGKPGGGNGGGGAPDVDAAKSTNAPAPNPSGQEGLQEGQYRVQQGDTLSGITQAQGLGGAQDYNKLVDLNKGDIGSAGTNIEKNPNLIHPGDVINTKAPGPAAVPGESGAAGPPDIADAARPTTEQATADVNAAKVPETPKVGRRLNAYFRQYYGTRRLAAEEDEQQGPPPDDGGEQAPPDQGPPPDQGGGDPSQLGGDPSQMGGAPPQDPSQGAPPAPLENQPAEDALLDTASQAVGEMIQRETQEYQQIIDPLQQAMQAIQFAQQVEQQSHPMDVTPPQGTVDVGPSDAAQAAQGPQAPPPQLQQQAARIARHYGMTNGGYKMIVGALGRKHYQRVADAISGLPPEHRGGIASSLADLFSADNPRFAHDKFYAASGVDPRQASRLGFRRADRAMGPLQGPLEHPMHRDEALRGFDDSDWDLDKLRQIDLDSPSNKYGPELGPYHPGGEFSDYYRDDPEGLAHYDDLTRDYAASEWARTSGVNWNETKNAPLAEHESYDLDPNNWDDDDPRLDDAFRPGHEPDYAQQGADWDRYQSQERNNRDWQDAYHAEQGEQGEDDPYSGDPMDEIAQSRMYQQHMQDPTNMFHGSRLGFNGRRQADSAGPAGSQILEPFRFPGAQVDKVTDSKTVTPDNIGNADALKINIPKKGYWLEAERAMDQWEKWNKGQIGKGLNIGKPPSEVVKSFAQETGVGPKAQTQILKNVDPEAAQEAKSAPKVKARKRGSFFTRRVPGWTWNDHLSAYTASSATPFQCHCGSQFDVPSYYNCRCGKVFNSYVIGSNGDDGRTASVDTYVTREVEVRPDMVMKGASRRTACGCNTEPCSCEYYGEGLTPVGEVDWVEDEDREHADAPHAPYKNAGRGEQCEYCGGHGHDWTRHPEAHADVAAWDRERAQLEEPFGHHIPASRQAAIGEDDHSVVYRDGDRFCSKCDALLWDRNVHHCPAKQATRAMFGEMKSKEDRDDSPTKKPPHDSDYHSTLTPHLKKRVDDKKGTDGDRVEEHAKGGDKKGTGAEHKKRSTRQMFGDWTIYDEEEDPGHGPGRREIPDTQVSRPDSRWHERLPEKGNAGQFAPPLFARR